MQKPHAHPEISGTDRPLGHVERDDWSPCAQQELFPNERMPSAGFHRADPAKYRLPQRSRTLCVLGWRQKKREDKRFNLRCAH